MIKQHINLKNQTCSLLNRSVTDTCCLAHPRGPPPGGQALRLTEVLGTEHPEFIEGHDAASANTVELFEVMAAWAWSGGR